MIKPITHIVDSIPQGRLLAKPMFEDLDLDLVLDQRDEEDFDDNWTRCNDAVSPLLSRLQAPASNPISEAARLSFMATSRATSHHEIASCVSDDFRLVSEALYARYENPWLSALLSEYAGGRLPSGALTLTEERLGDIVRRI